MYVQLANCFILAQSFDLVLVSFDFANFFPYADGGLVYATRNAGNKLGERQTLCDDLDAEKSLRWLAANHSSID